MLHDKIKQYGVRIIIIFLSVLFTGSFVLQKEGYHVDEILSYHLGNSEFTPWIIPTRPIGRLAKFVDTHIEEDSLVDTIGNVIYFAKDVIQNRGYSVVETFQGEVYQAPVWIPKEQFRAYLECDEEDAFNLLSVYYNAKDDIHPPLYYMLIHLVCSVFQGEITVWHGCMMNAAAVAAALWLLGRIGDMLFHRKSSTIALMLIYAFSSGIAATVLWVRMYAVLTLFLIWLLYMHIRKYTSYKEDSFLRVGKKTGRAKWVGSWGILILTLATFWTNYFGLFYLLPLAACTLLLLGKSKRFRECWSYIRTMLTAAVIGLGCFPFAVSDVFQSTFGTDVLSNWYDNLAQYGNSLWNFFSIIGDNVAGGSLLLILCFVIPAGVFFFTGVVGGMKIKVTFWPLTLCVIPIVIFFLLVARMSPHYVERYLMPLFPMTALLIVMVWELGFLLVLKEKQYDMVCMGLAVFLIVLQIPDRGWRQDYFYTGYEEQLAMAEQYADYPMVCLYTGYCHYENIFEMQTYRESLLVEDWQLPLLEESQRKKAQNGYIAIIKYPPLDDNGRARLELITEALGGTNVEFLGKWPAYGDVVYLVTP